MTNFGFVLKHGGHASEEIKSNLRYFASFTLAVSTLPAQLFFIINSDVFLCVFPVAALASNQHSQLVVVSCLEK
jgi:hypothetical protein